MTHGLQQLVSDLQGGTSSRSSEQLHAIQSLQDTLTGWTRKMTPVARTDRLSDDQKTWADRQLVPPTPRVPSPSPTEGTQPPRVMARPAPRVPKQSAPRVLKKTAQRVQEPPLSAETQPVAHRTRSARAQAPTSDPTTVSPTAPPPSQWHSERAPATRWQKPPDSPSSPGRRVWKTTGSQATLPPYQTQGDMGNLLRTLTGPAMSGHWKGTAGPAQ